MPYELTIDQEALQVLARELSKEADGKKLRRDLAKNLREALEPAKQEIRAELMGMSAAGIPVAGPPLRTTVLTKLKAEARLTGRQTGARLRIRKTPGVRGFANAPKRLNRAKGWRHMIYGRDVWVRQFGEAEYFDRPIRQRRKELRNSAVKAMDDMAARIAARTGRR